MTQEQIQQKNTEKVNQIKNLCSLLQITLNAKQKIMENGMIENIVVFTDYEQYPTDEVLPTGEIINQNAEPDTTGTVAPETNTNKDAEPTNI